MLKVEAQENACRAWSQAQSRLPPTTLFGVAPSGTNGFAHMFAQSCHGLRPSLDQVLDKVHAIHVKTHVGLRHIMEDQSYMIKGSELCVPLASTPKMHIPLCSMYAVMYIYTYIYTYILQTRLGHKAAHASNVFCKWLGSTYCDIPGVLVAKRCISWQFEGAQNQVTIETVSHAP